MLPGGLLQHGEQRALLLKLRRPDVMQMIPQNLFRSSTP